MSCTTALTNPALDLVPLAACVLDSQGKVAFANRAWQALTREIESLRELAADGVAFVAACERSTALEGSAALAAGVRQVVVEPTRQLLCC